MIELRNYIEGDEPEVMKLLETVLGYYGLTTNPEGTDADIKNIQQSYINVGGFFKVLTEDEKIIGSYGLYKITESICELRKMYIYKDYQGHGLGKLLMNDAFESAKKAGFTEMQLETNSKLIEAIGMYKKYGFEIFEPEHLSSRCDISMKKELR